MEQFSKPAKIIAAFFAFVLLNSTDLVTFMEEGATYPMRVIAVIESYMNTQGKSSMNMNTCSIDSMVDKHIAFYEERCVPLTLEQPTDRLYSYLPAPVRSVAERPCDTEEMVNLLQVTPNKRSVFRLFMLRDDGECAERLYAALLHVFGHEKWFQDLVILEKKYQTHTKQATTVPISLMH